MNYILYLLPAGGFLFAAIWIWCLCRAVMDGRDYYWLWLLLMFPPLGVILYAVNFLFVDERRGHMGRFMGRISDAKELRRLRIEIETSDMPAKRERLAALLLDRDEPAEALKHIAVALEHNPEDLRPQFLAGRALMALGKYDRALSHLEFVTGEAPDYNYWQATLLRAQTLDALGRGPEAVPFYKTILERTGIASAVVPAAERLMALGEREAALTKLRRLVDEHRTGVESIRRQDKPFLRKAKKLLRGNA